MTNSVKKTTRAVLAAAALSVPLLMAMPAYGEHHEEAAGPKVERIAATVLGVEDLEASVAFYTATLGMSVVRTQATDSYDEAILATSDADGTKLVLFKSKVEGGAPRPGGRVVFYTSDAVSIVEAFRAAGLEVERDAAPIAEGSAVRIGIVKDADGHTLEFIQRG